MKHFTKTSQFTCIDINNTFPQCTKLDNGCLFFLNKKTIDYPIGLYVYDALVDDWFSVNILNNQTFSNTVFSDTITCSLTNHNKVDGCTYFNMILSEDNTHAHFSVKGFGSGIAEGIIFTNADRGVEIMRADMEQISWMGNQVWTSKTLNPNKYKLNANILNVTKDHTVSISQILLINTSSKIITITLPEHANTGDSFTVIDVQGKFDVNNCKIKTNGVMINKSDSNVLLSKKDTSYLFIYQDIQQGWITFEGPKRVTNL